MKKKGDATQALIDAQLPKIIARNSNSLAEKVTEDLVDIFDEYANQVYWLLSTKLEDELLYATTPGKKLLAYEDELKAIKLQLSAIDEKQIESLIGIVKKNFESAENREFLSAFFTQLHYELGAGTKLKFSIKAGSEHLQKITYSQPKITSSFCKSQIIYQAHFLVIDAFAKQSRLRLKLHERNLKPPANEGFTISIPIQQFFPYWEWALLEHRKKVRDAIENIRFIQSERPTTSKSNNGKRVGYPWRKEKENYIKNGQLSKVMNQLQEEGFLSFPSHTRFERIFTDSIKPDAAFINWNNSTGENKLGVRKGGGAISFMLYFMYLLGEEFKLIELPSNPYDYLAGSFTIAGKEILFTSRNSFYSTRNNIMTKGDTQWMKTMRRIFKSNLK